MFGAVLSQVFSGRPHEFVVAAHSWQIRFFQAVVGLANNLQMSQAKQQLVRSFAVA